MNRLAPILFAAFLFISMGFSANEEMVKVGRLKYKGGGDWYANPSSLPNLISFCNAELKTNINPEEDIVPAESPEIINYPFIHMTGHGNVIFSDLEAENIRTYLEGGGFLHIDDNYGMDPFIRIEMKKIFPNRELVEIPYSHEIYHQAFDFENGLPKIHEHDGKPPKGYGIEIEGRIALFYSYECDLGDGWEDPEIHNDPEDVRQKALKMGANLVQYAFTAQ
ncbi:MAG: DUF4159 domain-containing protein [Bacteroidetes bacterium]|nr:DUF4159 domain-containing protein [Bacteroidota bacterium]